jgi:drug/metabolite transporter (DMT)-like permease
VPSARRALPVGDLLALLTVAIWSLNVIVVKVAIHDVPPLVYTGARFVAGGLLLAGVLRLRGGLAPISRRDLGPLALAALLGISGNQVAFTLALQHTTAVDVSLILGATPLMVAVWQALRLRERIGARAWAGLSVGGGGLAMVVAGGGGSHGALAGDLLALLAAALFTLYLDRLAHLMHRCPALPLSAWVTLLGALELVPVGAAEGAVAHPHWTLAVAGLAVYSSVLAVAVGNSAYYAGVQKLGPTRAAVYVYLQPFLGALFGVAILGETLRPVQLLGGVVVVLGVVGGRPRAVPVSEQQQGPPPREALVGES